MAFEVFNRKTAGRTKTPTISIQRRGTLSLNAAAAYLLADQPDQLAVELLYDPEKRMVGIRKAVDERNPYVLRKQANSESFLVTGRAFTEHYEIDTSVARRYNAEMHDGNILAIALDDEFVAVGRNGSGRRKDTSS